MGYLLAVGPAQQARPAEVLELVRQELSQVLEARREPAPERERRFASFRFPEEWQHRG